MKTTSLSFFIGMRDRPSIGELRAFCDRAVALGAKESDCVYGKTCEDATGKSVVGTSLEVLLP